MEDVKTVRQNDFECVVEWWGASKYSSLFWLEVELTSILREPDITINLGWSSSIACGSSKTSDVRSSKNDGLGISIPEKSKSWLDESMNRSRHPWSEISKLKTKASSWYDVS